MGDKIFVGPLDKGLRKDRTAFIIDNDSFPTLINAYQWRGRVKRKRGTSLLGRLRRFFNSLSISYNSGPTTITLNGSGVGNILTGFSLQANGNIFPGSVTITAPGPTVYTDPAMNGTLVPSGTINYATGEITILAEAGNAVSVSFNYYPDLPVMGLEDLVLDTNQFPGTLGFDTIYSYNILTVFPYSIYDVSFYKNVSTGTYPGYIQKTNWTPTSWNGQDYQQFWTVNYQGALWATNGINIPFSITNIGMQFKPITGVAIITAGNGTTIPAVADLTIVAHGLVQGDFLFINEVNGITGINLQTGYVTSADPQAANVVRVTFPYAILGGAYTGGGIAQYLTNRSDITKDTLRWYDGDPTNGNVNTPGFSTGLGWVNFSPPLNNLLRFPNFEVAGLFPDQYYLVGARMIIPFKDRLLFLGPVVQTSSGNPIYLQDTVIYSQNGTAYYTASFFGDPSLPTTVFNPILVPKNQTATPNAYWEDQTGFGGFITAGIDQPMNTVSPNEDVLIIGFNTAQTRLVYTGNDLIPFNFYTINFELGSDSTFSIINMDKGVMTRGSRGFIITSQVGAMRFDLEIPDQIFEINLLNNGPQRVCAQRDFINEWVYFTYPSNQFNLKFPNQSLLYNYRDSSWGVFNESYTTYGAFKKQTGFTWATVGTVYPTWASWNEPWNAGTSTLLQPNVIAGNQQGFVIVRDDGTDESNSLYIQNIVGSVVTSPDHSLNAGDYIVISGVLGTVGSQVNGKIFSISSSVLTANTFMLTPPISGGTYFGGGLIKRMYVPLIQTKQFPTAWGMARKTRIGPQQYLFTTTENSQITLLIFLSQNADNPFNDGPILPFVNSQNSSLLYTTILYTCPESANIGLTPANTNLNLITSATQQQTWHRMNTSLLGDTVQIGFTMSDAQMRDVNFKNQFSEIELHGFILDCAPSQWLA